MTTDQDVYIFKEKILQQGHIMTGNSYGLSEADLDKLIRIVKEFRETLLDEYGAQVVEKLNNHLTDEERMQRETLEMYEMFNQQSDKFAYALIQTMYMQWGLRPLIEAFGEDVIFDALPNEAKTKESVQLYLSLNEFDLAYFCEKAIEREKDKDNNNQNEQSPPLPPGGSNHNGPKPGL